MGTKRKDVGPRAVIQAAYDLEGSMEQWLAGMAAAARPLAEGPNGLGIIHAAVYERSRTDGRWNVLECATDDSAAMAYMRRIAPMAPPEQIAVAMRTTPMFCRFTDWMASNGIPNFYLEVPPEGFRLADHIGLLSRDGGGEEVLLVGLHSEELPPPTQNIAHWIAAGSHAVAALRLRRALGDRPPEPDDGAAVLGVDGALVHAEADDAKTESARERLRREVVHRERSQTRRFGTDDAITDWTPVVDGRWTLIDRFDGDGRRYYVAIPNAPHFEHPNALSMRERQVARMASHGLSNQEIGYALGLAPSSVATHLTRTMAKLGLSHRTELPILRQSSVGALRLSGVGMVVLDAQLQAPAQLTEAEGEVAVLAARGWSDDAIARRRRCATRTVSNLLRTAYGKLGVSSRAELADRMVVTEDQPSRTP